jgi:hypothetical protein
MDNSKSVFTPHDVGMAGYDAANYARDNEAVGIDLSVKGEPDLKEYFARLLPFEICAVQGQTSNGKSTFFDWWEDCIARQLKAENRNEVVVHVSVEDTIEAMSFYQYSKILDIKTASLARGQVEQDKLQWAMTVIDGMPIYRIGDSAQRDEDAPELYLSNIYRCIRELIKGEVTGDPIKPAIVFVDYLQALPIDPEIKQANHDAQRRLQVRSDVYRLRQMATHLKCPVVVGVQAKQKLDGANPPLMIPGIYDGEETASIAQRFDRIISLWMPKMTYPVGRELEGFGNVREDQVFLKVNKQRGGLPSGKIWELKLDFAKREFVSPFKPMIEPRDITGERD